MTVNYENSFIVLIVINTDKFNHFASWSNICGRIETHFCIQFAACVDIQVYHYRSIQSFDKP